MAPLAVVQGASLGQCGGKMLGRLWDLTGVACQDTQQADRAVGSHIAGCFESRTWSGHVLRAGHGVAMF